MEESTLSGRVRVLVERLNGGDDAVRDELLEVARDRLYFLTHRMLKGYPKLRAMEETDDVLQNAALRVWKALTDIQPSNAREFFGLSARYIRRELIDMGRRHFGRKGERDVPRPPPPGAAGSRTHDPENLSVWTEFHAAVENLPDEEREVADLLWYQELSQAEAADVIGVDASTVKRRWRNARLKLAKTLKGDLPGA